jgi:hypothetical protein
MLRNIFIQLLSSKNLPYRRFVYSFTQTCYVKIRLIADDHALILQTLVIFLKHNLTIFPN